MIINVNYISFTPFRPVFPRFSLQNTGRSIMNYALHIHLSILQCRLVAKSSSLRSGLYIGGSPSFNTFSFLSVHLMSFPLSEVPLGLAHVPLPAGILRKKTFISPSICMLEQCELWNVYCFHTQEPPICWCCSVSLSAYQFMLFSHVTFIEVSKKDKVVPQRHMKLQEQTNPYNDAEIRDQI
jgi:hypothetical protein